MTAWTEIEIRDGRGWTTGIPARQWMEANHSTLLPTRKESGKFVIVLKLPNVGYLFGTSAVAYLQDLLGDDFRLKQNGRHYPKQHKLLRRRIGNVTKAAPPSYEIQLVLLNCNRNFAAIANQRLAQDPWRDQGVQERLQALGYLYTPLTHLTIVDHAEKCFAYYKAVRQRAVGDGQLLTDADAVTDLIREVRCNLLTPGLPAAGVIRDQPAKLPASDQFAAIRVPGGYCGTVSPTSGIAQGDYVDNGGANSNPDVAFRFRIGDSRHLNETKVWTDNRTLGRFLIRARVVKRWPDGTEVPVVGAPVIFQLIDPEDIPGDSALCAEPLPNQVMDYRQIGVYWASPARPPGWGDNKGLNELEWPGVWHIAHAAWTADGERVAAQARADAWIDEWAAGPLDYALIQDWYAPGAGALPLPPLRNTGTFITKAKERVGFLLGEREAAVAHNPVIDNRGQRPYMAAVMQEIAENLADTDPQRFNATEADYGGKAGAVAGIAAVFPTGGAAFVGAENVTLPGDVQTHSHAVQCISNAEGRAGVIFTPARQGGDRYRLRICVDPAWLDLQPPNRDLTSRRTGTFVVWRNIRLGKYLRLPVPQSTGTGLSMAMATLLNWGDTHNQLNWNPHNTNSNDYAKMNLGSALENLDVFPIEAPEDAYAPVPANEIAGINDVPRKRMYRPVEVTPAGWNKQFRRAYCQLMDDTGGVPHTISRDELRTALGVGKVAWAARGRLGKAIHWDSLILDDDTSPFLLTFRSFHQYNTLTAVNRAQYPELTMAHKELFEEDMQAMVEGMLEHFAGGGVLPGLSLVHVGRGQTYDARAMNIATPITSGYGTGSRAFWLSHTRDTYRDVFWIYSATSNALHEVGHVLGLCHQPPAGADIEDCHEPGVLNPFSEPELRQTVCVMSYSGCYGDYCGKCILQLRGWHSAHVNTLF